MGYYHFQRFLSFYHIDIVYWFKPGGTNMDACHLNHAAISLCIVHWFKPGGTNMAAGHLNHAAISL
jgi:hypothetical protein